MNQSKLDTYYRIVEDVIRGLGVPIEECRSSDSSGKAIPGQWNLTKGSAKFLWTSIRQKRGRPISALHLP